MLKSSRIIAFHGFLGQGCDFDLISTSIKELSPQSLFYAPDLFSSAGADFLPESFSVWPELFKNKLQSQIPFDLKREAHSPRILMGYSLGGRLALDLYLRSPEHFDILVLLAPNPGLISAAEKSRRLISDQLWSEKLSEESWSEFLSSWNAQDIFKTNGRSESDDPVRFLGDYSIVKLKRALTNLSLGHMRIEVGQIQREQDRIFWLSGEGDPKIHPLYQTLKSEGLIRNWETIPQSGHRLLFDNPRAVARTLVGIAQKAEL